MATKSRFDRLCWASRSTSSVRPRVSNDLVGSGLTRISVRFHWPGQRRRTPDEIAAGIVAAAVGDDLRDELLGVWRQEPLRIPGDHRPPSDRCPAVNQRHGTNNATRHLRIRGNDCDAVAGRGQREERVRGGAFQQHPGPDMGDAAGGIEPIARSKIATSAEAMARRPGRRSPAWHGAPAGGSAPAPRARAWDRVVCFRSARRPPST